MTPPDAESCLQAAQLLPPLTERFGVRLTRDQVAALARYCEILLESNERINLTAVHTPGAVMRTLVLDSLTAAAALPDRVARSGDGVRVVDVGSGSGAPGLPLKIAFPHWSLLLVESVRKKARFLEMAARTLRLENVSVLAERAELVGAMPPYRDAADLCLARAVAALPGLIELCAPLVRPGGVLAFPKSGPVGDEIEAARAAERALQVRLVGVTPVREELGLGAGRVTVVYVKTAATPPGYPRRVGLATSRPIGVDRGNPNRASEQV